MARKKPEAILALEAIRPSCACGETAVVRCEGKNACMECYERHFREKARASMETVKLQRWPEESIDSWRRRAFKWLMHNATVKRFGADT